MPEKILGADLDSFQRDVMRTVWDHPRVHIQTANEVGKTFVLACLSLSWLYAFGPACTVVCTASSQRQIYGQFWSEVKERFHRARYPLGGQLFETKLEVDDRWFMVAFSTSNEANFEGWHNKNILVLFDEAKGIQADIYKGAERLLRGEGGKKHWVVAGSPPLAPIGEFCRIKLDPMRARRWEFLHISGWDSPRVSNEACQIALEEYGEDNPFYQSMVEGKIPMQSEGMMIDAVHVEDAAHRDLEAEGEIVIACDVARYGNDETVILTMQGGKVLDLDHHSKQDTVFTMSRIREKKEEFSASIVRVDDTGVGGGVTDQLRASGIEVEAIDFGSSPEDPEQYADRGTEMWANVDERLQSGDMDIPDDPVLKAQLSMRPYGYVIKGQHTVKKIVPKDRMREYLRKRGESEALGWASPDRADALVMACAKRKDPPSAKNMILSSRRYETYKEY